MVAGMGPVGGGGGASGGWRLVLVGGCGLPVVAADAAAADDAAAVAVAVAVAWACMSAEVCCERDASREGGRPAGAAGVGGIVVEEEEGAC